MHIVPIAPVQLGGGPDGDTRLGRAGAVKLVHGRHMAQVLEQQDKAVAAMVKVAVEQGRRPEGNLGRELAIESVFPPVEAQPFGGLEGFRVGTRQLDDDAGRPAGGIIPVGQPATEDFPHHTKPDADIGNGDSGNCG